MFWLVVKELPRYLFWDYGKQLLLSLAGYNCWSKKSWTLPPSCQFICSSYSFFCCRRAWLLGEFLEVFGLDSSKASTIIILFTFIIWVWWSPILEGLWEWVYDLIYGSIVVLSPEVLSSSISCLASKCLCPKSSTSSCISWGDFCSKGLVILFYTICMGDNKSEFKSLLLWSDKISGSITYPPIFCSLSSRSCTREVMMRPWLPSTYWSPELVGMLHRLIWTMGLIESDFMVFCYDCLFTLSVSLVLTENCCCWIISKFCWAWLGIIF